MWLAQKMKPAVPEAEADQGVSTIVGDEMGVVTRGEVRRLPVYGPGGYVWLPESGASVLVIKGGPGGEEQCVCGGQQGGGTQGDAAGRGVSPRTRRRQRLSEAGRYAGTAGQSGHPGLAVGKRRELQALHLRRGGGALMLRMKNGDYVPKGSGLETVSGSEAVLQRVLLRLTARRGAFPFMESFGSRLWTLGQLKAAERQAAAEQYVAEALAEETGLTVDSVTLTQSGGECAALTVQLTAGDTALTAEVTLQ